MLCRCCCWVLLAGRRGKLLLLLLPGGVARCADSQGRRAEHGGAWCYPVCHRHWPDTLRKYLWSSPKIFKLSFQGVMGLGFSHLSSTRLRMQMEVWRERKMIQGSYVTPWYRIWDNAGNVSVSIAAAHRTHQAVTRDVCCCQPAAAQGIIMEFLKRLAKFWLLRICHFTLGAI